MDNEGIHNQALSEMGDYTNYRYAQHQVAPLRELVPGPERADTFGNPFRRKSNAGFLVDEVSVDDVGFSGFFSTVRKRSSLKSNEKIRGECASFALTFRLKVQSLHMPSSLLCDFRRVAAHLHNPKISVLVLVSVF